MRLKLIEVLIQPCQYSTFTFDFRKVHLPKMLAWAQAVGYIEREKEKMCEADLAPTLGYNCLNQSSH